MVFDDLDAGLVLLSISDRERHHMDDDLILHSNHQGNHVQGNHQHLHELHNIHDHDDMDIDSPDTSDLEVENVTLDSPEVLSPVQVSIEHSDSDSEEHSSFASILSPTTLGAKFALAPRKLLMPPPDDHDYEFDTQVATFENYRGTPELRQRGHQSTFEPAGNPLVFLGATSPAVPDSGFYTNSMNSFQYGQIPVQVHHHHYYRPFGPDPYSESPLGQNTNSQVNANPNNQISSNQQINSSSNQSAISTVQYRLHQNLQTQLQTELQNQAQLRHDNAMLPLPWAASSFPAERTPYVLSSYLQLLVNLVISCYALHLLVLVVHTIRQDVEHKLAHHANNVLVEIALCERDYYDNNCSPETIVPALEKMCGYWEKCMNQDPFRGGNASLVGAHTIGMIVNLLVEPLSAKVLLVAVAGVTLVFACNFVFGYVRAKTYYGWLDATATHNLHDNA